MLYCPVILSLSATLKINSAQQSRRSGVQLAASQASSSLTNSGGKDASATLSMTKRLTCVTSGINFKTASEHSAVESLELAWFPGFIYFGSDNQILLWNVRNHVPLIREEETIPLLEW